MMSWLLCKGAISARHAVVVTDFDIHAIWLCHHYSRYFVAIDETREHLEQLGFEHGRISVSGIPVDPVFIEKKDKQTMRHKHALDSDRLTILISAGGFGMVPMEQILSSLKHLKRRFQVVAVCGQNKELRENIQRVSKNFSLDSSGILRVVGYTSEMDEYMAASDLILGKPGGLTACEALTKGLVFVIVSPIPGQEERNADHLVEEGVAIRCNNLPTLAYKIDQLLRDPPRLRAMQENCLRLGRPHAAEQIAREVCELIEEDTGSAVHPAAHRCAVSKHLIAGAGHQQAK
jgi:processive 1,2-diacylglycerol beta-glucosyltransferase